ncbi:unnamed protein product, partial [Didymodactylos carnosus]
VPNSTAAMFKKVAVGFLIVCLSLILLHKRILEYQPIVQILQDNTLLCQSFGWNKSQSLPAVVIYDLFTFSHELDILEIRLHELYDYVDYFFIIESSTTFSGKNKSLNLLDYWYKFKQYHKKMKHISINIDVRHISIGWEREHYTRAEGLRAAYEHIRILPNTTSILILSDVDEIPKVKFVLAHHLD